MKAKAKKKLPAKMPKAIDGNVAPRARDAGEMKPFSKAVKMTPAAWEKAKMKAGVKN